MSAGAGEGRGLMTAFAEHETQALCQQCFLANQRRPLAARTLLIDRHGGNCAKMAPTRFGCGRGGRLSSRWEEYGCRAWDAWAWSWSWSKSW